MMTGHQIALFVGIVVHANYLIASLLASLYHELLAALERSVLAGFFITHVDLLALAHISQILVDRVDHKRGDLRVGIDPYALCLFLQVENVYRIILPENKLVQIFLEMQP
jgi:hypothetical protein